MTFHRLSELNKLFVEFANESSALNSFIEEKTRELSIIKAESGNLQMIRCSQQKAKDVLNQIISNEMQLKSIKTLGNRTQREIDNYVVEMRVHYADVQFPSINAEELSATVGSLQAEYDIILRSCHELIGFLNRLHSLTSIHTQNTLDAEQSIGSLEERIASLETIARTIDAMGDSTQISSLLSKLEEMQHALLEQSNQTEAANKSAVELNSTLLVTDAYERIKHENQCQLDELERRRSRAQNRIDESIDYWRKNLAKAEGLRDGIANITNWLKDESVDQSKPVVIPLAIDKLVELRHHYDIILSELASRQKVFVDLQSEAKKIASTNLDSQASKKTLEACKNAHAMFTSLTAASKGHSDNVKELLAVLNDYTDQDKVIDQKLIVLAKILSQTMPDDRSKIIELKRELENVIDNDWADLQRKSSWILNLPGIDGGEKLKANVEKRGNTIHELQTQIADLCKDGHEIEEQRNLYDNLKVELLKWLEALQEKANVLGKSSLDPVDLARQKNELHQLSDDYQMHRQAFQQLHEIGSKLIEMETVIKMKVRGKNSRLEQSDEFAQELACMQQKYQNLGHNIKSELDKINTYSERLSDWDLCRDAIIRWIDRETQRLECDFAITLDPNVIQSNTAKINHLELIYKNDKQSSFEEVKGKFRELFNDHSVPGATNVSEAQNQLENNWREFGGKISVMKIKNQAAKQLIDEIAVMDKWLKQKERMLSVIGNMNVNPKVIDNQIIQIQLLQNELGDHCVRDKINELAHQLITENSIPTNSQQIIGRVDEINRRWVAFEGNLEERNINLHEFKVAIVDFNCMQRDVKRALLSVAEAVEGASRSSLTCKSDVDQQLSTLNALVEHASDVSDQVNALREAADILSNITDDPTVQSDIREQMDAIIQNGHELRQKIESLKNAAMCTRNAECEVIEETGNTLKWIKEHKQQLDDIGPISAELETLNTQRQRIDDLYHVVLDKEGDIALLRAKMLEQMKKVPNPELKAKMEELSIAWNPILDEIKAKRSSTERAASLVNQLNSSLKSFANHMEESRKKLQNVPVSKTNDSSEIAEVEQSTESLHRELNTLQTLLNKVEDVTAGPSLMKTKKEVKNMADDFKSLVKDVKNTERKSQQVKDAQSRLIKCKDDGESLLSNLIETLDGMKAVQKIGSPPYHGQTVQENVRTYDSKWQKQKKDLESALQNVQDLVGIDDAKHLEDAVQITINDFSSAMNDLQSYCDEINNEESILDVMKQRVDDLESQIVKICSKEQQPIGRECEELKKQNEDCVAKLKHIENVEMLLDQLVSEWKTHRENGTVKMAQMNVFSTQLDRMKDDLNKHRASILHRQRLISNTQLAVQEIQCKSQVFRDDIENLLNSEAIQEPTKMDLKEIRAQQERLKDFRENIRSLGQSYATVVGCCNEVMKTAAEGISTESLETEKMLVTNAWDRLNTLTCEREKQLCELLQELGSYSDAYNSLLSWLQDTEESLANQRAPSIEHNVVKEQTRANDILIKHIEEKQQSVEGFKKMIENVVMLSTDVNKRNELNEHMECICQRYSSLLQNVCDRRRNLHEAIVLTQELEALIKPLKTWLDATEQSLQQLGNIPTDEEKLQNQMLSHKNLQKMVENKQQDFDKLARLFPPLAALTSEEDAVELESVITSHIETYNTLNARTVECGHLLVKMGEELASFLKRANDLSNWLDGIEREFDKLENISIHPDELVEQSTMLAELAMAVTEQEELVSSVVDDGRELCRQTTGNEAIALQGSIEALRVRYSQLASLTDAKIALLSEALPLSERFHDGIESVRLWMDAVEHDFRTIDQVPLEAQSTFITQVEDDFSKWRLDVDEICNISKQLQHLNSGLHAEELANQTDDLVRRFGQLSEQVTRKADKLNSAEKQSRQVLDELDYLNEWFTDARDRLIQASAPAVDPDYVKKQLKNQKQMNEDIAVMKARLRDAAADAQKVARSLGDDSSCQNSLLASKIESGRALSADVAQLSEERLGELEQALALCLEVDQLFGELHSWLEKVEAEIDSCPAVSTSHQRDQLMQQQMHNVELQNSIASHKLLMDRFLKNIMALSELCDAEDEAQLEKIADGLNERLSNVRDIVKHRAEALEAAIEQSSQFTDRLDVWLANLDGISTRIRANEPITSDPERIRSQILENQALMDDLKHKEGVLKVVRENAKDIVARTKANDPATVEISSKINQLNDLWNEIIEGVAGRGVLLNETLTKAERFWDELERCQKKIDDMHARIELLQPATGQLPIIEKQRATLSAVEEEMRRIKPSMMEKLWKIGAELYEAIPVDEKALVDQRIHAVDSEWSIIAELCAHKNVDLIEAMEKTMDFHGLLSELSNWVKEAEVKMSKFELPRGSSSTDVRNELSTLYNLRALLDEKALEKEQLNQLCANLCVGINAQQCALIRAPVNELNSRWGQLYVLLNDRQQKMEKALLEMGHFSQACEQLMSWIEKTEHILNEIDPRPSNLKQAEIEVCKHRVLQNDVLVHEASLDTLNTAVKRIISSDPQAANTIQPMIDALSARWHTLVDKLEDVWEQLNDARKAAESLGGEMDRWALWLQDKDADLSHTKPTGGLPDTAKAQLNDFFVLKAEIDQHRADLEAHLEAAERYLSGNANTKNSWTLQRVVQMKKKWARISEKITDREQKLNAALAEAEQLYSAMNEMNEWLKSAESRLGRMDPVSRNLETLEAQSNEFAAFQSEVSIQRELMTDLSSKGTKLQYYCEKKDAIPIKNSLVSAKHRFDKISSRTADRGKQLNTALQESRLYYDSHAEINNWLDLNIQKIKEQIVQTASQDRLRGDLEHHKELQHDLAERQISFETTFKRGKVLVEHSPRIEQNALEKINENLRHKWSEVCNLAEKRLRLLEDSLLECGQFDDALSSLREWLEDELPNLKRLNDESVYGDLETVTRFCEEHRQLNSKIAAHRNSLESVRKRAQQMLNGKETDGSMHGLREKLDKLNSDWDLVEKLAKLFGDRLEIAVEEAKSFDVEIHNFLDWLPQIESRLRTKSKTSDNENDVIEQLDEVAQMRKQMDDKEPQMCLLRDRCMTILAKCHPLAEQPMKYWSKILQTRWEEVSTALDGRRDDLEKQIEALRAREKMIADLLKFITEKNGELKSLHETPLPQDMDVVNQLIDEHDLFEEELRAKQSEIDEATKGVRKPVVEMETKKRAGKVIPKHERSIRHPRSEQLSDRWKKLWIDSMEYGRHLREKKQYLEEVKKLESFSFEEWRERYLGWTDSGKSRISDLFRRIDKSGTGRVPRSAFIEGIIASKFPTSYLEMEKVADEFDKGDGMIDAKEFMSRLRNDFSKMIPLKQKTDIEKINEEVIRQSERCSCRSPYRIQKVGEGHYRFGETQIKRMVRILRSTVMVRVGGGWVALEEFLHKHDPCRARGRTNVVLQRGFYDDVRPQHAFDTMETFTKSARSTPGRSDRGFTDPLLANRFQSTPGPITKVREKTERSMPMHFSRRTSTASRTSPTNSPRENRRPSDSNGHGPNSSDNVSKPGSHADLLDLSRPVSRCSDISDGDRPTRIPSLRGRKGINYRPANHQH